LLEAVTLIPIGFLPDPECGNGQRLFLGHELVHADDDAAVLLDFPLLPCRGLRDLALEPTQLESFHDATGAADLPEDAFRGLLELVGERFEVVRAAERGAGIWQA